MGHTPSSALLHFLHHTFCPHPPPPCPRYFHFFLASSFSDSLSLLPTLGQCYHTPDVGSKPAEEGRGPGEPEQLDHPASARQPDRNFGWLLQGNEVAAVPQLEVWLCILSKTYLPPVHHQEQLESVVLSQYPPAGSSPCPLDPVLCCPFFCICLKEQHRDLPGSSRFLD